jgi:hypothetical protein
MNDNLNEKSIQNAHISKASTCLGGAHISKASTYLVKWEVHLSKESTYVL